MSNKSLSKFHDEAYDDIDKIANTQKWRYVAKYVKQVKKVLF